MLLSKVLLWPLLTFQLLGWDSLTDVGFKFEYVEQFKQEVEIPIFGDRLEAREGKMLTISGYFVPAVMEKNTVMLSKLPYASCFFCGGAGIESVIEVHFLDKPRKFRTDEIVRVRGKLKLNARDFDHLIFILEEAEEVE